MKLTPEEIEYSELNKRAYGYFPLFKYKQCIVCNNYFRREYIWEIKWEEEWIESRIGGMATRWKYKYACKKCLPTKKYVIEVFKNNRSFKEL